MYKYYIYIFGGLLYPHSTSPPFFPTAQRCPTLPSVLAWIKPSPGPQVSLSTAHSPTLTTGSTCLGEAEGQNLWSAEDLGTMMSLQQGYHKMALFTKNWVFIRLSDKIQIPWRCRNGDESNRDGHIDTPINNKRRPIAGKIIEWNGVFSSHIWWYQRVYVVGL